jgi:hypothetical protein
MTKSKSSKKSTPPPAKKKPAAKPKGRSAKMSKDPMEVDPQEVVADAQPPANPNPNPSSTTPAPPPPYGLPPGTIDGRNTFVPDENTPRSFPIAAGPGGPIHITGTKTADQLAAELEAGGEITETLTVQWPVAIADTDIAVIPTPTTVVVGSSFRIGEEYMEVVDISNADNPTVTRATNGSTAATHDAGASITVYGAS